MEITNGLTIPTGFPGFVQQLNVWGIKKNIKGDEVATIHPSEMGEDDQNLSGYPPWN